MILKRLGQMDVVETVEAIEELEKGVGLARQVTVKPMGPRKGPIDLFPVFFCNEPSHNSEIIRLG